jgi:hypothetical protein
LPRWRSLRVAAGYWGSPAVTVASGPQEATYGLPRGGNYPRTPAEGPRLRWPHRRAPHEARREMAARCGGVGRDPGARVVAHRLAPRTPDLNTLPGGHSGGFTGLILAAVAIVAAFMIIQYYSHYSP